MKEIFVGNIGFDITEPELKKFFDQFGEIETIKLITDRETGRTRGFGFVKYVAQTSAEKAIKEANGALLGGRNLKVNLSQPRKDGGRTGGGSRGGDAGRGDRRW